MASILKNPISLDMKNEYYIQCYIGEKNILVNDVDELLSTIKAIELDSSEDFYIDLTFNTIVGSKSFAKVISSLKHCYNKNGNIDIFTSGRNLSTCASFLSEDVSNVNVFVDDYEVQNILEIMNLEKINFNCHLSERYLLNLDDASFDFVLNHKNFKFDRDEMVAKRKCIKKFWDVKLHGADNIKYFSDEEKVMLVLDYINDNVDYEDDIKKEISNSSSSRLSPIEVLKNKQGSSKGMAQLACFLLNNSLANVDCHEVEGYHKNSNSDISWIVTKINGNKYGHCLVMPKRFKKLSNYGYVDGRITLEPMQFSRMEYNSFVEDYSEISETDCLYLSYSLNEKMNLAVHNEQKVVYVKSKKNTNSN